MADAVRPYAAPEDARILDAWAENAAAWTEAVRGSRIESRRRVTDAAILAAVRERRPASVLDLGCGEGWLARALTTDGVRVLGVDAVPELVERARQLDGGEFRVLTYEAVAAGALATTVDAVVCNFSLLGAEPVAAVLRSIPALLEPGGALIVQTLHPVVACGDRPYEDGWREGSWDGCGPGFGTPAPWYFRTLESWERLLADAGLVLRERREPAAPASRAPASVLFIAETDKGGTS